MRRVHPALLAVATLFGAGGCGSNDPLEVAGFADAVVTIGVGQSVRIYAELTGASDALGAIVRLESDNGGIASHEPTAPVASLDDVVAVDVTGVAPGETSLRAYVDPACAGGACGATTLVRVVGLEDPPAGIDALLPDPAVVAVGDVLRMTVTLRVTPVDAPAIVTLSASSADVALPETTVEVPSGVRSATFDVEGVSTNAAAMIVATMGDSSFTTTVSVE